MTGTLDGAAADERIYFYAAHLEYHRRLLPFPFTE